MPGTVDLHLHTTYSDGTRDPASVVRLARQAGLTVIAITDHDTIDGHCEARAEGERLGVRVIPALELSVEYRGQDIHVLAYFVDTSDPGLTAMLDGLRAARRRRIEAMLERLHRLGLSIEMEEVLSRAPRSGPVGRPHLAEALVAREWVETYNDAFRYYLSSESPAYLSNRTPTPEEALGTIRNAGGVPVLAHPGCYSDEGRGNEPVLDRFLRAGLMGLEAFHPRQTGAESDRLMKDAKRLGLLITAGSDYHGEGRSDLPPGSVTLSDELFQRLEEASFVARFDSRRKEET